MKANEAPEKVYLLFNRPYLVDYTKLNKRRCEEEVEYIRTDAFIKKACEFISLNAVDYIDVTHKGGIEHLALQERFIDAFKKYIEKE